MQSAVYIFHLQSISISTIMINENDQELNENLSEKTVQTTL
jgi:hypothetical protein